MSQFNLANKTDGVLRKRSNESKSDKVINDAGIDSVAGDDAGDDEGGLG